MLYKFNISKVMCSFGYLKTWITKYNQCWKYNKKRTSILKENYNSKKKFSHLWKRRNLTYTYIIFINDLKNTSLLCDQLRTGSQMKQMLPDQGYCTPQSVCDWSVWSNGGMMIWKNWRNLDKICSSAISSIWISHEVFWDWTCVSVVRSYCL
jgi:hypothetical protein